MLVAMTAMFIVLTMVTVHAEQAHDVPSVDGASLLQAGGNMEGTETRFGVVGSALYATVTTSGGDGAVNEYLAKKIDAYEMKMAAISVLVPAGISSTANNKGSAFAACLRTLRVVG